MSPAQQPIIPTSSAAPDPACADAQGASVRGLTASWRARGDASAIDNASGPARAGLLERVLAARGMRPGEPATQAFLEPSLRHLHEPGLMSDLDKAAQRLLRAVRDGERVVIYGDYDVDGISASAILFHALRSIAPESDVRTYVPHRIEEGYGLNAASLAELCRDGARVIVSVDCGITAVEAVDAAMAHGAEVIVTDHHLMRTDGQLPRAFALVHPRVGGGYPFGELCGAGVAFKLAWRLMVLAEGGAGGRVSERSRAMLLELLALASLGVVADMVPLVDENRVMARFGLSKIKHSGLVGLRALVDASGLGGENVRAEDVGFQLGPRLNAAGRLGHAREAVEMLTTADAARARQIADELCRQNDQRRRIERETFAQACERAEAEGMTGSDRRAIVLADARWHPGVVGIVCARLVQRYHRPALLLHEHAGECHGSGRSVEGVSLHAALAACAGHLRTYGGHDMAAGLRLSSERMGEFVGAFVEHVNGLLPVERLVAQERYDAACALGELTIEQALRLESLAPFGRGNPRVQLRVRGVRIATRPTLMGQGNKHVSLSLADDAQARAGSGGERAGQRGGQRFVRAVAWGWGERIDALRMGVAVDVLARPVINRWNGSRNVELELVDVAPARGG